jgi:hypothetical protein
MAAWIMGVGHYHSELPEERLVFHDGGWLCPDGKRILGEHLAEGKGGRSNRCDECKKRSLALLRDLSPNR